MTAQNYRLLLIDEQPENYHLFIVYLGQLNDITDCFYELDWINPKEKNPIDFFSNKYDVCLIDAQWLPSLNHQTVQYPIEQVNSAPIIVLTDDCEIGMMAIKAGAADYFDKTQLTLATLERSLRLTLANKRLQQQNEQLKKKIATNLGWHWENKQIEANFSAILEQVPVGIALMATSGQFLRVNPKLSYLLGYSQSELCSYTFQDLTHPQDLAISWQYIEQVLTSSQGAHCGFLPAESRNEPTRSWQQRYFCKNGQWKRVSITVSLIKDSQGSPLYVMAVIQEIQGCQPTIAQQILQTSYRQLVKAVTLKIRQSLDLNEIFQTIVTQLHQTLHVDRVLLFKFLPDGSGKTIEEAVSPQFPAMLGKVIIDLYCQKELSRKYTEGYIHICPDIERAELSVCHRQFLQQYQIRANLILPIFQPWVSNTNLISVNDNAIKEQNYLWGLLCVQQCSQPRYWSEDEIELLQQLGGQLNIALSQAKLLASEIKQRQELARSNAELEQFAYIASHDLQAPLQTISNYTQLLERRYRGQLDDKADKYINYIVDGAQRMRTQIDDLLEYSRFGRQRSTFRTTDCNLVVEQAIANLRAEIEQNEVIINYQNNLPTLIADSSQLIVLFQNLLGNSIKYRSVAQPVITIAVMLRENSWQFSVSDNGIGIEPKYQNKIFQIFQRLHTREEYPGTGMGLAICQKIVKRHGGNIWVDSQLNCGATFYFTLAAIS
jgi:PAS domain S-box-containing protein